MSTIESTAAAALETDAEKQRLTVRDRLGMAVLVSGGWWMALIFTAIAPILSAMSDAFDGGKNGYLVDQLATLAGGTKGYWVGQLTMTIPDIGIIVGGPIVGLLIERYSARMLLFISLALYAVSGSAGMFVHDGATMLSTRLLLGFAGAGIATSTTAMIGNRFIGETRVKALAYWNGVGAAGGVVSVMLAGRIADLTGGWQGPFSLYAMAVIVLAVGIVVLPPRVRAITAEVKQRVPSIKPLIPLYLGMIPIYVAVFMTGVQISFLLSDDAITDPVTQSWVIGTASGGSVLGAFVFSYLRPRFGSRITMLTVCCLLAAGNLVMPLTHDALIIAAGAAMNGMGGGMANPHFAALLIERAPILARGRAIGILFTVQFFGEFMNPFVVTPLAGLLGIHGAFLAVSALLGAGALAIALYRKRAAAGPLIV